MARPTLDLSLQTRLLVVVFSLFALVAAAILAFFPPRLDALGQAWAERRATTVAHVLASSTAAALDFDDAEVAGEQLAYVREAPDSLYAVVRRDDGSVLAAWRADRALDGWADIDSVMFLGDAVHVSAPIVAEGGARGRLEMGFSLEALQQEYHENLLAVIGLAVAVGGLGMLLSALAASAALRPMRRITDTAHAIADGQLDVGELIPGGESPDTPPARRDEIRQLAAALGDMARQLQRARLLEVEQQASREEAASARAASAAKSQFLATMSHELRTPLNAVIGLNELLLDTPLNDEQREYVTSVHGAGEALLGIINQVLDLSRVEAGRLALEAIPFDPVAVVGSVIDMHRATAATRNVALGFTVDGEPTWLLGDPSRLRQVLLNLVGNALKFTAVGGVHVHCAFSEASADAPSVGLVLAVSDTGLGISEEAQARIFQPFAQADDSTTRLYGGTGLGLAIVRALVENMGGEVTVASEPGEGSTFSVSLTLPRSAPEVLEAVPLVDSLPAGGEPWRILVAEDHPVNQLLIERMLTRMGCEVSLVGDGHDALEALAEGDFDLVLMDCQMPRVDGYQATREVRQGAGRWPGIPIVALTANAMKEDEQRCLDAGMDAYLTKPLRSKRLVRVLAPLLKRRRAA